MATKAKTQTKVTEKPKKTALQIKQSKPLATGQKATGQKLTDEEKSKWLNSINKARAAAKAPAVKAAPIAKAAAVPKTPVVKTTPVVRTPVAKASVTERQNLVDSEVKEPLLKTTPFVKPKTITFAQMFEGMNKRII